MSAAGPLSEREVLNAFQDAVGRYCAIAGTGGTEADLLKISVLVTTRAAMSHAFPGKVHRIAHRHVDEHLPRARVVSVDFAVDNGLPAPGHRFLVQPPAGPVPKQTLPFAPAGRSAPAPPTVDLTLRYGVDFHWVCHLAAAPEWVPLGRWTSPAARDASVRLPEYATFLPRGELLYLRHHAGRVEFARSWLRPDYLVRIDGSPLRAGGHRIEAAAAGSIEYADGTASSTLLDYHLAWEDTHG